MRRVSGDESVFPQTRTGIAWWGANTNANANTAVGANPRLSSWLEGALRNETLRISPVGSDCASPAVPDTVIEGATVSLPPLPAGRFVACWKAVEAGSFAPIAQLEARSRAVVGVASTGHSSIDAADGGVTVTAQQPVQLALTFAVSPSVDASVNS